MGWNESREKVLSITSSMYLGRTRALIYSSESSSVGRIKHSLLRVTDPKGRHLFLEVVHQSNLRRETRGGWGGLGGVGTHRRAEQNTANSNLFEETADFRRGDVEGSRTSCEAEVVRQKRGLHTSGCNTQTLECSGWSQVEHPTPPP